jgi:hypothetical protein
MFAGDSNRYAVGDIAVANRRVATSFFGSALLKGFYPNKISKTSNRRVFLEMHL